MQETQERILRYGRWLARHWILGAVALLVFLNLYTFTPGYAQSGTPTPDIHTVPRYTRTPTPPNTPVPTVTPEVEEATATPIPPTATKPPSSNNNNNNSGGGGAPAPSAGSGGNNAPVIESQSAITLTAIVNTTTLNMRRGPTLSDGVIDILFKKDVVEVLARNEDGTWWLVCCGNRTQTPGWVDAHYLEPNFDRQRANELIPLAVEMTSFTTSSTLTTTSASDLQFEIRIEPDHVWQGQTFQMKLIVTNSGRTAARNVRLRDQLPTTLQYIQASSDARALVQEQTASDGAKIVTANWATLAAGAQVTLNITLQIEGDLTDGVLIDNLAVVSAEGVQPITNGITFAMPPLTPPTFH